MTQSSDAKTTYNKYVQATETVSGGAVARCGGSSSESGDATAEESYSVSIEPMWSVKFGSVSEDTIISRLRDRPVGSELTAVQDTPSTRVALSTGDRSSIRSRRSWPPGGCILAGSRRTNSYSTASATLTSSTVTSDP